MKNLFKINYEYYVFISGALISLHINVLFLLNEKWNNLFWWIALISSLIVSILFFGFSIRLRELQNKFADNIKYAKTEKQKEIMWLEIFNNKKRKLFILLGFIFLFMCFTILGIKNF